MSHTAKTKKILELVKTEKLSPAAANPVVKPPEREHIRSVFVKTETGTQILNVGFLLINEQLGQIMERFNCCMCWRCVEAVTKYALAEMPYSFVTVKDNADVAEVNRIAAKLRSAAVKILTKSVMAVKHSPPHENN